MRRIYTACGLVVFFLITPVNSGWAVPIPVYPALDAAGAAYYNNGVPTSTSSYGAFADAATFPCNSIAFPSVPCAANVQLVSNGGEGYSAAAANLLASNSFGASAIAAMPSSTTIGINTYQLANLSVQASQNGTTGSQSVAYAAAWDTLTFSPTAPGTTGTLLWTISLTKQTGLTSQFDDMAYGFSCFGTGTNTFLAGNSSDPFGIGCPLNLLQAMNPGTFTYSVTINLDQPVGIYEGLWVEAFNDFNVSSAMIDPAVTLILPDGVSFTTASGLSGGTATTVPEPATLALVGITCAAMGFVRRRKLN